MSDILALRPSRNHAAQVNVDGAALSRGFTIEAWVCPAPLDRRVRIYPTENYQGDAYTLAAGRWDDFGTSIGVSIGSVEVPPGFQVVFFANPSCVGDALPLREDAPSVSTSWSARSALVIDLRASRQEHAVLFEEAQFSGRARAVRLGEDWTQERGLFSARSTWCPPGAAMRLEGEDGTWFVRGELRSFPVMWGRGIRGRLVSESPLEGDTMVSWRNVLTPGEPVTSSLQGWPTVPPFMEQHMLRLSSGVALACFSSPHYRQQISTLITDDQSNFDWSQIWVASALLLRAEGGDDGVITWCGSGEGGGWIRPAGYSGSLSDGVGTHAWIPAGYRLRFTDGSDALAGSVGPGFYDQLPADQGLVERYAGVVTVGGLGLALEVAPGSLVSMGLVYTFGGATMRENRWEHVALTWDGQTLRWFVGGQQVREAPATGLEHRLDESWELGDGFQGALCCARLWNTARTVSEIAASRFDFGSPAGSTGVISTGAQVQALVETQGASSRIASLPDPPSQTLAVHAVSVRAGAEAQNRVAQAHSTAAAREALARLRLKHLKADAHEAAARAHHLDGITEMIVLHQGIFGIHRWDGWESPPAVTGAVADLRDTVMAPNGDIYIAAGDYPEGDFKRAATTTRGSITRWARDSAELEWIATRLESTPTHIAVNIGENGRQLYWSDEMEHLWQLLDGEVTPRQVNWPRTESMDLHGLMRLAVSPDGTQLAFVRDDEVGLSRADVSGQFEVAEVLPWLSNAITFSADGSFCSIDFDGALNVVRNGQTTTRPIGTIDAFGLTSRMEDGNLEFLYWIGRERRQPGWGPMLDCGLYLDLRRVENLWTLQSDMLLAIGADGHLYLRASLNSAWILISGSLSGHSVVVLENGTILVMGDDQRLYTRADLAADWLRVPGDIRLLDVAVSPDGSLIGVGQDNSLYAAADLASSWTLVPNSGFVQAVTYLSDGTLLGVGTNSFLYTRSALTSPWQLVPDSGSVIDVERLPDGRILGVGSDNGLVVRESLNSPWTSIKGSGQVRSVAVPRDVAGNKVSETIDDTPDASDNKSGLNLDITSVDCVWSEGYSSIEVVEIRPGDSSPTRRILEGFEVAKFLASGPRPGWLEITPLINGQTQPVIQEYDSNYADTTNASPATLCIDTVGFDGVTSQLELSPIQAMNTQGWTVTATLARGSPPTDTSIVCVYFLASSGGDDELVFAIENGLPVILTRVRGEPQADVRTILSAKRIPLGMQCTLTWSIGPDNVCSGYINGEAVVTQTVEQPGAVLFEVHRIGAPPPDPFRGVPESFAALAPQRPLISRFHGWIRMLRAWDTKLSSLELLATADTLPPRKAPPGSVLDFGYSCDTSGSHLMAAALDGSAPGLRLLPMRAEITFAMTTRLSTSQAMTIRANAELARAQHLYATAVYEKRRQAQSEIDAAHARVANAISAAAVCEQEQREANAAGALQGQQDKLAAKANKASQIAAAKATADQRKQEALSNRDDALEEARRMAAQKKEHARRGKST